MTIELLQNEEEAAQRRSTKTRKDFLKSTQNRIENKKIKSIEPIIAFSSSTAETCSKKSNELLINWMASNMFCLAVRSLKGRRYSCESRASPSSTEGRTTTIIISK